MSSYDFAAFVDALRTLRTEERAVAGLLERAARDPSASELIARDHQVHLARIRSDLERQRADARGVLDVLVNQINQLRQRALEVRRNIEDLRDHADLGGADPKLADFASDLQKSYRELFGVISDREVDLTDLQEELREADGHDRGEDAPSSRPAVLDILDTPQSIADPLKSGAAMSKVFHPNDRPASPPGRAPSPSRSAELAGEPAAADPTAVPVQFPGDSRERKRQRRYPYHAPVRIRASGRVFLARSADISRRGMFVEGQPTLPAGSVVVLGLAIHDFPLELSGVIVYETPGVGMGVRFTGSSELDERYLETLIEQLRRLEDGPAGVEPSV